MATTDFGWYRCPNCGQRTQATEETSGPAAELPPCQACASVRGSDEGDPALPEVQTQPAEGGAAADSDADFSSGV